ncbi:thioredoxin domain-containing protein [Aureibacter tunicatorum]|uniref:Spermatogenesis-associated protein 20-like TRX domain-containing protein n=1 Tax=Aureibacter tunicatorum TaxID=866807 RepID=A0AAE3XK67_9BACT|nr:thioredoxin domain-containing protein [Aureibacter tunicatorum]MDR6239301.1 hypothetical protein [Aureibacter tunicatorum]BDD04775.1 thioredoxin [Aureibacter tunicatorum]
MSPEQTKPKYTNDLIHSKSPYLLQHAHNPVNWKMWNDESLQESIDKDKPILLSIGYSACHWCHVMERECFENEKLAQIMNEHFVCIKLDREERPDIDNIYMDAVQKMGIQGGWPLNVFLTPDQMPFYGGTYFPPTRWEELLMAIDEAFKNRREELTQSAKKLTGAIQVSEKNRYKLNDQAHDYAKERVDRMVGQISRNFDPEFGGIKKSPKFPMPSLWEFLLNANTLTGNEPALQHALFTLDKMAYGGIYDIIGGGFCRYSVDERWFAPHFEKMLYDNGQLMSLYAKGYLKSNSSLYKSIIEGIDKFATECLLEDQIYHSALDADSEGVEGKFYTWTYEEILNLISEKEAEIVISAYQITKEGNFEDGQNIIFKNNLKKVADQHKISVVEVDKTLLEANQILFEERKKRVMPGLDNKALTSWNAMMNQGLTDAFLATKDGKYLDKAVSHMNKLLEIYIQNDSKLLRSLKDPTNSALAYLEDYAHLISALLRLHQATLEDKYALKAKEFADYVIENFYDNEEKLYFYSDQNGEALISRKKDIFDQVIPSSNAVMADNLYYLSQLFDDEYLENMLYSMLNQMAPLALTEVEYMSKWASIYAKVVKSPAQIILSGSDIQKTRLVFEEKGLINEVFASAESELPMAKDKANGQQESLIFVCSGQACYPPVKSVKEAMVYLSMD